MGAIGKDSLNKQQGFKYRGIDTVMNALNPAFIKASPVRCPGGYGSDAGGTQDCKGWDALYSVRRMKYTFYAEDGSHIEAVVVGEVDGQRR